MPYRSMKQMRYMHAKHPKIAKRWDREYGGTIQYNPGKGKRKPKVGNYRPAHMRNAPRAGPNSRKRYV